MGDATATTTTVTRYPLEVLRDRLVKDRGRLREHHQAVLAHLRETEVELVLVERQLVELDAALLAVSTAPTRTIPLMPGVMATVKGDTITDILVDTTPQSKKRRHRATPPGPGDRVNLTPVDKLSPVASAVLSVLRGDPGEPMTARQVAAEINNNRGGVNGESLTVFAAARMLSKFAISGRIKVQTIVVRGEGVAESHIREYWHGELKEGKGVPATVMVSGEG